jgi:hypothetical protein
MSTHCHHRLSVLPHFLYISARHCHSTIHLLTVTIVVWLSLASHATPTITTSTVVQANLPINGAVSIVQLIYFLLYSCTAFIINVAIILLVLSCFSSLSTIRGLDALNLAMPSTGLSSGVKIQYGSQHRNAQHSVVVRLNRTAAQLSKEWKNQYNQLTGMGDSSHATTIPLT